MGKVIAAYGGGFKPPTGGHFQIVKNALAEFPEIDEFIIYVGSKERDGIDQSEAILVWEIYQNYLANKVTVKPSQSPIGDILRLAKDNPQDEVYFIIGYRDGRDDDMKDVASRTSNLEEKYPNIEVKVLPTFDANMSGTNARKAIGNEEDFVKFLPPEVKEKSEIWNIIRPVATESINENASYSQNIDYKQLIADLTNYMIEKGRNIEPLPKLEFIDGDSENAKDFFGKTAYYDPASQTIVLYTEGRHPKDIVRSYSHEMVHHTQNLEDRLEGIEGTDTTADENLDKIEQEANLIGTMTFRNWTDSILNENLNEGPQFGVLYHFTQYLSDVLDDNILRGPISLTRSLDSYAAEWLGDQPYFILDKDKLRTKYKIRPFKDTSDNPDYEEISQYDEMEEVIDTDIINLSKYIIKVVLPHSDEEWEDALKEKGISYEIGKPLNEAIVGDKIECDKCGWSWKIKDGGDDLFMCHKCGHNNEPMNEDKDYFGLNALVREIMEEPKYKIFSDMDGVLTDFDESFKKASDGIAPRDYEKKFGKDKFWELIDGKGVGYWVGMPYMSDGEQYWNYIKDYDVELLSSPSRSSTSRLGKRLWVRNNMPGVKLTLAQAYLKKNYAAPNHILIDDRKSNIDEWRAAGGIGILHTSAAGTIQQLKKLGL